MFRALCIAVIALAASTAQAQAQAQRGLEIKNLRYVKNTVENFERSFSEQFAPVCQSFHIFEAKRSAQRLVDFSGSVWRATLSPRACSDAHNNILASIGKTRIDEIYRDIYEPNITACIERKQLPSAEECHDVAYRAARRKYILDELTSEVCISVVNASADIKHSDGFCISIGMPVGEEEQWKSFISLINSAEGRRPEKPCLSRQHQGSPDPRVKALATVFAADLTGASASERATRAGFECQSSSAGGVNPRTQCSRPLSLHAFEWNGASAVLAVVWTSNAVIDIEASPTGGLKDVCLGQ